MPSDTYILTISESGVSVPSSHASTHLTGGSDPIPVATTSTSGLMSAAIFNQHVTNTAKVSNVTHTGDVTDTSGVLTVNKINGVSMAGLATGIVKNTTGTGAPSIAVAADFPILNQNTSGNAATATYATTAGSATTATTATSTGRINNVLMSGLGTGILKNTTGTGAPSIAVAADFPTLNQNTTGNAATATNLSGGAAGAIPYQTSANTTAMLSAGTAGYVLKSNGSSPPSWEPVSLASGLSGSLPVSSGGTGATTLTGIVKGNGTSAFTTVTAPTGDLVGTTDAQTLTNKTLGSGTTVANLGTPSSGTLTNCTSLPIDAGTTGTLPVSRGGSGATTLTGILRGNGTSAFTAVTAPTGALVGTTDTQTLTNKTLGSGTVIDAIGTPSSGTLTNCTGLPISAGTTGTLPVNRGGTGAAILSGILVGNGTNAVTTVTAPAGAIVGTTDTQILTNKTLGSGTTVTELGTPNSGLLTNCSGLPLTTGVTGTLPASSGGTGLTSYGIGDLLYASTSTTLSKLASVDAGNALISGGAGSAPLYGKIGLTTHVTGILPATNGGTGTTSSTGTGSVVLATSPTLVTPDLGTPASGTLTSCTGLPLTTGVTGTLQATNGGTGLDSYAIGDILFANSPTTLSRLGNVATGNVILSGGVGGSPSYGKVGLTTHVIGTLPVVNGGTGHNTSARGQIFRVNPFTAITVASVGTFYSPSNAGNLDTATAVNMTLGAAGTFSIKNTTGATRVFRIYASADATAGNNDILAIKLFSGTAGALSVIDASECRAYTSSTNAAAKLVTSWLVTLANNQEVAIYLANTTSTTSIIIERARLIAEAVI